jgi:hypothetical protein
MLKFCIVVGISCGFVFVTNALAQQNPTYNLVDTTQHYTTNADGSLSQNKGLGGWDHSGECTKTFTIAPSPIQVFEGASAPAVTFNAAELGGTAVKDAGSLVPQTFAINTAFNIHSGGFVEWTLNGPKDSFASGTKPGAPYSRLTSEIAMGQYQTKASPVYATSGCQVVTATMQGDFKHNAQDGTHTGSYRCIVQQSAIVQVALPLTTLECSTPLGPIPPAATYYFTPKGGEDLTAVIRGIYGKHATTFAQRKKLYQATLDLNKNDIPDAHHLPSGKRLHVPGPDTVS